MCKKWKHKILISFISKIKFEGGSFQKSEKFSSFLFLENFYGGVDPYILRGFQILGNPQFPLNILIITKNMNAILYETKLWYAIKAAPTLEFHMLKSNCRIYSKQENPKLTL